VRVDRLDVYQRGKTELSQVSQQAQHATHARNRLAMTNAALYRCKCKNLRSVSCKRSESGTDLNRVAK
jgi:hypothetical protein